jgi:hypothetical protein
VFSLFSGGESTMEEEQSRPPPPSILAARGARRRGARVLRSPSPAARHGSPEAKLGRRWRLELGPLPASPRPLPSTAGISDPTAAVRRRCSFPPPSLPPRVVGLARESPGPAPHPRVACMRYDTGFGVGSRQTGCHVCFRVPRCG